jgi:pyruvate kinase
VADSRNAEDRIESAAQSALKTGYVSTGDLVVITSGYPVGVAGGTKMVRVKKL